MEDGQRTEWFAELPEEAGFFWFYGKQFPNEDPCWAFVRKFKISNGFMATMDGHFMYDYKCEGQFCRVQFPDPPTT